MMTKTCISLFALIAATPALALTNPAAPATDASGDAIVVTATRSPDPVPVALLGASVTVIEAAALDQRQTRIVSDVLRDAPGVAVSRTGAVGGQTSVRLRGAEGNHTLVLIDGIEVSDPYTGEFDFGTLLADESARVEVLRGQQSALYGSDAIGGVINYITSTGAETPGIRLRAEGGSMETYSGGARVAGASDGLDYALSGSYLHTGGYPTAPGGRRDLSSDNASLTAKLDWAASENLKIGAVGRYGYTDADTNNTNSNFLSPNYGLTIDSPGVRTVYRGLFGLVRAELSLLDDRFTNVLTGQIADTRRKGYDVANASPNVQTSGNRGQRLKGSYAGTFRFGSDAVKQSLTGAIDVEREEARATVSQFGGFLGRRRTTNTGLVAEYDLTANDRLGLGAAIRHDDNSRFASTTTWRVHGSYILGEGTRLHAAAGSGVKAPSFGELFDFFVGRYIGNPDLKPEKSTGWEAGVEQGFLDRRITIGATYFDNRLKDEISVIYTPPTFTAMSINLPGKTKQRGVEVSAAAKLDGGWSLDASYTYLHAPQTRSITTNAATFATAIYNGQAVRRAKNIASANLTYAPEASPFAGTLTVRYNGRQGDVFFGTFPPLLVKLRSFTLVNLNASYKVTPTIELFGRVENALDRNYQEVFSFETPGRAGYGGVRVRL